MPTTTMKIPARAGGAFDCYLATPDAAGRHPAIVLASAVHGVDADIRALADEFAANGFIAAAPDLFWRTVPGPLSRDDKRAAERAKPRLDKIAAGEPDLADMLAAIRKLPQSNGRAAVMGFCYGGPYAIVGPKRLGYDAGISCHGSQMQEFLPELDGITAPICIMWGDRDHIATAAVRDAYRAVRMPNLEVHIFPDVEHGYMMPGSKAFDAPARAFSMARTLAILDRLRADGPTLRLGS
jgi:carboxymethylenebutenolidase